MDYFPVLSLLTAMQKKSMRGTKKLQVTGEARIKPVVLLFLRYLKVEDDPFSFHLVAGTLPEMR